MQAQTQPPLRIYLEAGLTMVVASVAVRLFGLRSIRGRKVASRQSPATPRQIYEISRATRAWARRLPWRTLCFEQGLTAHWMLRRRALASTLYYGAAKTRGQLKAHVWVKSDAQDVIGCESAAEYALLATFPPEAAA